MGPFQNNSRKSTRTLHKLAICCLVFAVGCSQGPAEKTQRFEISDPDLRLELVASSPAIQTPIGLAIDVEDNLYVLESHTHTPPDDYAGPKFDRIKKGVDTDRDGIPESWAIYADSLEDGMNLAFGPEQQLFVTTKNAVWAFRDLDGDGNSDQRTELLIMDEPESPYDHAAILGLAVSPDHRWLFVSRGNTGGSRWTITGSDGSSVGGYGDGGSVMRCTLDGKQLQEVATGFWNPFDIKFSRDGRLLLTDNDPDSRGPNRLIELVPGGDYGYKSLYGGSGIHPFVAWNGELPGTLPYAAPLGEAPCALLDAGFTGFGPQYENSVLVNIWEEKNIVRIPLSDWNSSIRGEPQVLIQGDSTFHPVALASNSRGEVYITNWVIRQYPNHGQGEIWRLTSEQFTDPPASIPRTHYRFAPDSSSIDQILHTLASGDPFQKSIARLQLEKVGDYPVLLELLKDQQAELRLQSLLVLCQRPEKLGLEVLAPLLQDPDERVRLMTIYYAGTRQAAELLKPMEDALKAGWINPGLFEPYLAAVQNLQPQFIKGLADRQVKAGNLERVLPDDFIRNIIGNGQMAPEIRSLAIPYLETTPENHAFLTKLLPRAESASLKISLISGLNHLPAATGAGKTADSILLGIAQEATNDQRVRSLAVAGLSPSALDSDCNKLGGLLHTAGPVLQYAVIKRLCACSNRSVLKEDLQAENILSPAALSLWQQCNSGSTSNPSDDQWKKSVDGKGDTQRGELVFGATASMCNTCHRVNGWGGSYGPDLTHIGSSKSQEQLINAILQPSMEMAPEWQGWYVVDQQGNRHVGRQIDVHLNRVELMNIQGEFDSYPQPRSFGISQKSVMPEGLQNNMTLNEFNDLIAYLMSLK